MSVGSGRAHEVLFGPPSALIRISEFLASADNLEETHNSYHVFSTTASSITEEAKEAWRGLPSSERDRIQEECRVNDIQTRLNDVIKDPALLAHVTKFHEATVHSIYEATETTNRRKRKRVTMLGPAEERPDVAALKLQMDSIQLKSWPLSMNSALFIRPPKQADHNTLIATKQFASASNQTVRQALVFVTVYNPLAWGHRQIARGSQHVFLSSQTLHELFQVIPCPYHKVQRPGNTDVGSVEDGSSMASIEGVIHGSRHSHEDYCEQLLQHLQTLDERRRPVLSKGEPLEDTTFESLSVRLQVPYWLMHSGNCEHFVVFEEIRLHHPKDPPCSAFPLTTQITPPLLDNCRACNKVPAVYSIVGDVRLAESPFLICGPCWRWMGPAKGENAQEVTVMELPKFEIGWRH